MVTFLPDNRHNRRCLVENEMLYLMSPEGDAPICRRGAIRRYLPQATIQNQWRALESGESQKGAIDRSEE